MFKNLYLDIFPHHISQNVKVNLRVVEVIVIVKVSIDTMDIHEMETLTAGVNFKAEFALNT